MFLSQTVVGYLARCGVEFDVVTHRHSATSIGSARSAHIRPQELAKAVLMRDREDYVLPIVPATRRVNQWALQELLDSPELFLAGEDEMPYLFRDCERGAIPAVGKAFGLETAVDEELLHCSDIYFEGGDHEHLVHLRGDAFAKVVAGHPHGHISY